MAMSIESQKSPLASHHETRRENQRANSWLTRADDPQENSSRHRPSLGGISRRRRRLSIQRSSFTATKNQHLLTCFSSPHHPSMTGSVISGTFSGAFVAPPRADRCTPLSVEESR